MKHSVDAYAGVRVVLCLVLLGCGRSESSVEQEFKDYVAGANRCEDASDCAIATAGCPLGCFVAVRGDRKADVERKARDLVAAYERGGRSCDYDCIGTRP